MAEPIVSRVLNDVQRHALIAPGDTVVVAVSGGADSLCLLYVLHALMPRLACHLHVAHLDHALRPASADDAAFVAARSAALGLRCTVERRDVATLGRERRLSVETAARTARYAFLRTVAAELGATTIATGHTLDDQAETLLLRLARGSGLNGLAGMRPRRDDVIRPLLEISHAETSAYCAALGLQPRDDESNHSPAHDRNRVRHEALPRLAAIQPAATANIARAARLLAADLALVERLAGRALDDAVTRRDGDRITLSVARWSTAEPELRPHMLRLLLIRLLGQAEGFDERHYALIRDALDPWTRDAALTLPKGIVLRRHDDVAVLGAPAAPLPPLDDATLPVPGAVVTAAGTLRAERACAPSDWSTVPASVAYLDAAAAGAALQVRAWRRGDRLWPLGCAGTRKVQDIFVDAKIPRALRQRIPIVTGARGIAWIAGLCSGEAYRVAPGTAAVRVIWSPDCPDLSEQAGHGATRQPHAAKPLARAG